MQRGFLPRASACGSSPPIQRPAHRHSAGQSCRRLASRGRAPATLSRWAPTGWGTIWSRSALPPPVVRPLLFRRTVEADYTSACSPAAFTPRYRLQLPACFQLLRKHFSNSSAFPGLGSCEVVRASAGVYEALVAPRLGAADGAAAHAAPRVLWHQRAFAGAVQPLLQARCKSGRTAGAGHEQ